VCQRISVGNFANFIQFRFREREKERKKREKVVELERHVRFIVLLIFSIFGNVRVVKKNLYN
jgi:uncharacterized protein YgfB (UPF0149 family)